MGKTNEKLILFVYSIYTVGMTFVSQAFDWGKWIPPVILTGMVLAWIVYVKQYKNYNFRSFLVTGLALMEFVVYGLNSKDLFAMLSLLGAVVVLLGVFNIPKVVFLSTAVSVFLIAYHGLVLGNIHITSARETVQMILQLAAVFVIEYVTYYLVKRHIEMQEALEETIENLKKAEQSKDDFMANVSHEIRTPINTVCGMSEMVLREDISDRAREYAYDIQTAGRNLLSVVSDILDFSELASGKMDLVEEPYNPTSTLNDVINMAVAQNNGKNLELIVDCDANIPSSLLGDEQKIRRVIMNLVNNAIKFTREGGVIIRFSERREEYGINLLVSVKDTGIGMKSENLEKLFTTFNQVDSKKNREEGGIGLGLAISQALVKKMGGFITVNSVYGKGSEVQFVIPQKVLSEEPMVSVKNPDLIRVATYINMEKYSYSVIREGYAECIGNIVKNLNVYCRQCRNLSELKRRLEKKKYSHIFISWEEYGEDKAYFDKLAETTRVTLVLERENECNVNPKLLKIYKPFSVLSVASVLNGENVIQSMDGDNYQQNRFIAPKANVLVVDDNMMNLKVVEGLLRPYKIKVFTALSGKEALQKLETMEYDFVFMDHMMPEMDGVETLHNIRKRPGEYFKNVPIIALTANAIGGVREMFLAEGFADFVAKPIELSVLERVLRKYIPENKIIKVEEYEHEIQRKEEQESKSQSEGELRLEGIDVQKGIAFCGGALGDYLEVIQVYYETGLNKIRDIEKSYETEDWKNYTILVHAVKSTSLGIGAEHLSEMAKELEKAGKESNASYIRTHHEEMMTEYHRVMEVIKAEIVEEEDEKDEADTGELPELQDEQLEGYLEQLTMQLETFESMGVEQVLWELFGYQYHGRKLEILLAEVQSKVKEFDFMGAADELAKVKEKMR